MYILDNSVRKETYSAVERRMRLRVIVILAEEFRIQGFLVLMAHRNSTEYRRAKAASLPSPHNKKLYNGRI